MGKIDDLFSHLTNASINKSADKSSEDVKELKKMTGPGYKWTMEQLWEHLEGTGLDRKIIWKDIKKLVLFTLLILVGQVPPDPHCYEILGIDVMIDCRGKPWLIEVNRSPAMATGSSPDKHAKTKMLTDAFNILSLDAEHITGKKNPVPAAVEALSGRNKEKCV